MSRRLTRLRTRWGKSGREGFCSATNKKHKNVRPHRVCKCAKGFNCFSLVFAQKIILGTKKKRISLKTVIMVEKCWNAIIEVCMQKAKMLPFQTQCCYINKYIAIDLWSKSVENMSDWTLRLSPTNCHLWNISRVKIAMYLLYRSRPILYFLFFPGFI